MELLAPATVLGDEIDVYAALGVRRVINATCHWTRFGGASILPVVADAMRRAVDAYVDVGQLLDAASDRISHHTHGQASYIVSGCAAGLMVGAAAVMTNGHPVLSARLPDTRGMKHRWVARRMERRVADGEEFTHHGYAHAVRGAGGVFDEVGTASGVTLDDIDAAITPETVGIYWMGVDPPDAPSPEEVIGLARRHGVPILIDASNTLPPPENLHRFTDAGADLVAFSGGKGLRGPQGSGFLTGRADLIAAARAQASPTQGIGRVCKVSKEEMIGLVAAIEHWVARDHRAAGRAAERRTVWLHDQLVALPDAEVEFVARDHLGRAFPTVHLTLDRDEGVTAADLCARLLAGDPPVAIMPGFDPWTARIDVRELSDADAHVVADALYRVRQPGRSASR
ncbi:MAG: aminotransferase class V-fold PLP-dependent enzyme [Chloroflexota bacterium]|nr:MAG: aminotransferase class V-fold PLP-dependent enzyme [Chloroflexota bacterium]